MEVAAFLPIIAPYAAYLVVKRFLDKKDRINYKKSISKGNSDRNANTNRIYYDYSAFE